ncbi:MAG: SAM-dependent methyltransferase [Nitrospira sp.]|nr:MAG: SAM-dependent methyltransferase [Nitrospira sp.]
MAVRPTPHHTISRVVAQTLEIYDRDARRFLTRWGKPQYKRPLLLGEWLTLLPKRAVLLDLGCGGGQDSRYLKTMGHRVVGLDRTMPLLQFAKERAPSVPLILADMRVLPVRAGSLDGIWAAASLMHLPKAAATDVLVQLRRRLRPRGLLAASVTYGTRSGILQRGWMPGRYFARWRKSELASSLRRAGWKIVALRVVSNQERKGRWINVIARREG